MQAEAVQMAEVVQIGIKCASESIMLLKVKQSTSVVKIVRAYCDSKGLKPDSLRILFDGERIPDAATVLSLGMENGDR